MLGKSVVKPTPDPWQAILQSLHPEIDQLQEMIDKIKPVIKAELSKKNRRWQIKIKEVWPVDTFELKWTYDVDKFGNAVEWADHTLKSWDSAKRESWDTWSFDSKKNAEQFITFYILACKN